MTKSDQPTILVKVKGRGTQAGSEEETMGEEPGGGVKESILEYQYDGGKDWTNL